MPTLPAFKNHALPIDVRIEDLLSRLNLEQKCAQLRWNAPGVEEQDIPAYNWWNEALHGVGRAGKATVFPQAIGLSASWDPRLIREVANAIADEARAKHNESRRQGSRQQYQGLTFWSPNINIFRDPRWGRGQETWGEDPFLTGELGAAFVRGLQGDHPRYLKTAACAKHFAVHSGPEASRHGFNAEPPLKDFEETYLPAFKRLVEEGVEAVMGGYNAIYGEPCNGSFLLLEKILRHRWGFQGHVVSDCWAIKDFHEHHKVTSTAEESAALAIRAGCDLNCGSVYCDALLDAVNLGYCTEGDIDRALTRVLRTRFKLGMFDPDGVVPYSNIQYEVVCCEQHRRLAEESALRSVVLLKNRNAALPLAGGIKSLLVVGPYAAGVEVLLGNYFGISPRMTSLIEGIAEHAPAHLKIDFRKGCLSDRPNLNVTDWTAFEAANADVVIAAVGINPNMEGEAGDAIQSPSGGDRTDCRLPANQTEFLLRIAQTIRERNSPTRLIVVIFGGSHLIIPEIDEIADGILQAWYPGEAGGDAIAQLIFGKASPEGRLTITVPKSVEALPPFEEYAMKGRTYRFMNPDQILYPFGFGLSYTEFCYTGCSLQNHPDDSIQVKCTLTNSGAFDGGEIVQVYARLGNCPGDPAPWSLVAFERVFLKAGQSHQLSIPLKTSRFRTYAADGSSALYSGGIELAVGGCSPVQCSAIKDRVPLLKRMDWFIPLRD